MSVRTVALAVVLVGCGGSTQAGGTADGGVRDAAAESAGPDAAPVDAAPDAPAYLACMNATGQLDDSLKTCQNAGDCVIKQEQTDCCGTILYVGVNQASSAEFDACEASWVGHFPGCGCASNQTKTEDGKTSTFGSDAGAPQVHCTNFTSGGGICLTFTP